jgi:hypothetical protein
MHHHLLHQILQAKPSKKKRPVCYGSRQALLLATPTPGRAERKKEKNKNRVTELEGESSKWQRSLKTSVISQCK